MLTRSSRLVPGAAFLLCAAPCATAQRQFKELEGLPSLPRSSTTTRDLVLGDVDGDGDRDLVVAIGGVFSIAPNLLYLNDGTGRFVKAPPGRLPQDNDNTQSVALGDVDADGDLDIVFGNGDVYPLRGEQDRLYLNDGSGAFSDVTGTHMPPDSSITHDVEPADVDGDGDLDLLLASRGQVRLYLNDGSGRFTDGTAARMPGPTGLTEDVAAGDVDGDGDVDVVVARFGGGIGGPQNHLYLNEGTGTFSDVTGARLPLDNDDTFAVVLGDVDGDGDLDIALGNATARRNRLYLNDGGGTFVDVTTTHMPADRDDTFAAALGDVDEDGDLDLVFGNGGANLLQQQDRLLLNDGTGRFTDVTAARMPVRTDNTTSVGIADVDGDDDLDLVVGTLGVTVVQPDRVFLNLHRQLSRPALPVLSRPYVIELFARPGYASSAHTAVSVLGTGVAPVPLSLPPLGRFYLLLPVFPLPAVSIPVSTGMGVLPLLVPGNPSLVGAPIPLQALILDSANPADAHFTGYLADRIQG